jgi:hypothetical protein
MQEIADAYQMAAVLPVQNRAELELSAETDGGMTFTAKAGEALWLTIPRITGSFGVYCNEQLIATREQPALYPSPIPYAVQLRGLQAGENTVEVRPIGSMSAQRVTLLVCTETI